MEIKQDVFSCTLLSTSKMEIKQEGQETKRIITVKPLSISERFEIMQKERLKSTSLIQRVSPRSKQVPSKVPVKAKITSRLGPCAVKSPLKDQKHKDKSKIKSKIIQRLGPKDGSQLTRKKKAKK